MNVHTQGRLSESCLLELMDSIGDDGVSIEDTGQDLDQARSS